MFVAYQRGSAYKLAIMAGPKKKRGRPPGSGKKSTSSEAEKKVPPLVIAVTEAEYAILDEAEELLKAKGSRTNRSQMVRWAIHELGVQGFMRMPTVY